MRHLARAPQTYNLDTGTEDTVDFGINLYAFAK